MSVWTAIYNKTKEKPFLDKRLAVTNVIKNLYFVVGTVSLSNVCYFADPKNQNIDFDLKFRQLSLFVISGIGLVDNLSLDSCIIIIVVIIISFYGNLNKYSDLKIILDWIFFK